MSSFLAQRTATGWLAIIGTLPSPPKVNIAPKAAFSSSVNDLTVSVDGTTSTDVDGTVRAWAWTFGDGATATGATATHKYSAAGTFTVTLIVTDDDGAKSATVRQSVTVTAPVVPVSGAYTQDTGINPATNGAQPTGGVMVPWSATTGSSDLAKMRSVGSGKQLSLPVGTVSVSTFTTNSSEKIQTSGGIVGAGSARSILKEIQDSAVSGAKSNMLRFDPSGGLLLQDFTLQGTKQANRGSYTGLFIGYATNPVVRRTRIVSADPGYQQYPPGETFGINALNCNGGLFEDVEIAAEAIAGQQAGASLFGPNGCTGTQTYNRCYAHGGNYSAAWAVWQHVGDVVMNDCVMDNCRAFWNCERNTGSWISNRPRIGTLKSATTGWGAPGGTGNPVGTVHVVAETDKTWHDAHPGGFRFEIHDPRNLDGTPYNPAVSGKIRVGFISGNDKGPNLYNQANFRVYNAAGTDVTSTYMSFNNAGGVGV